MAYLDETERRTNYIGSINHRKQLETAERYSSGGSRLRFYAKPYARVLLRKRDGEREREDLPVFEITGRIRKRERGFPRGESITLVEGKIPRSAFVKIRYRSE